MTTMTESAVSPAVRAAINDTASHNVSLADRAMLAAFTGRLWAATKTDKRASLDVADRIDAARSAARVSKRLAGAKDRSSTAKDKLENVKRIMTEARTFHYFMTRSWLDNGSRILSVDAYPEYTTKMAQFEDAFYAAVEDFVPFYPTLVREASLPADQGGLGALFNAHDYPPQSEIRSYFAMGTITLPMPSAPDFRADIGEIEIQRVRKQLEGVINQAVAESNRELIVRILKPVAHMAESLRDYKVTVSADGKKTQVENKFHDTLVENVRKQAAVIPLLNVTNDPFIADLGRDIEASLIRWDASVLRASDSRRSEVAAEAQRIVDHVSEFLA